MELALGGLGWTPDTFWSATLPELFAAINGWNNMHGDPEQDSMNREELEEMMKRFPDGN